MNGTPAKPSADCNSRLVGTEIQVLEPLREGRHAFLSDSCEARVGPRGVVTTRLDCEICLKLVDDLKGYSYLSN